MKIAAIVLLVIGMIANVIMGITNVLGNEYATIVATFKEYGMEFPISKQVYDGIYIAIAVLAVVVGLISLFFLLRKKESKTVILTMGIISIFFVNLIAGILMIVYSVRNPSMGQIYPSNPHVVYEEKEEPTKPNLSDYDAPRTYLAVGDVVLTKDEKRGVIVSINEKTATVNLMDGRNITSDVDDLKRIQ